MPELLGKTLKKIRESKKLSIEEVSERTRISKKIISAIEEDRLYEIPSAFYARGFVKSYAQFLGALEEKPIKQYLGGTPRKDKPVLILNGEKVPGDWFIKYKRHVGAAILVIFGLWLVLFSFIQMTKFVKNVSERYKAQVAKKKEIKKVASRLVRQPVKTVHAGVSKKESEKKQGFELEVTARYNTWVYAEGDEELLFRGILKKGTKDTWRAEKEIQIELGNAGGVTLRFNGKNLGSPGKKGEKKKIIITKDGIKD